MGPIVVPKTHCGPQDPLQSPVTTVVLNPLWSHCGRQDLLWSQCSPWDPLTSHCCPLDRLQSHSSPQDPLSCSTWHTLWFLTTAVHGTHCGPHCGLRDPLCSHCGPQDPSWSSCSPRDQCGPWDPLGSPGAIAVNNPFWSHCSPQEPFQPPGTHCCFHCGPGTRCVPIVVPVTHCIPWTHCIPIMVPGTHYGP